MAFTNPVAAINTSTTLNAVTISSLTLPSAGQLMIASARATTTGSGNPPSFVVTGFTPIGTATNLGGGVNWTQMFYKIALGTEVTVAMSFSNGNTGSGNSTAVLSYLEIDGFVGPPTLDQQGTGNGSTANNGVTTGTVTTIVPNEVWVTALANSAPVTASSQLGTFYTNTNGLTAGASNTLQAMYAAPVSPPTIVTGIFANWSWTWTTNRVWGITGATFYDPEGALETAYTHHAGAPTSNIAVMRASNY